MRRYLKVIALVKLENNNNDECVNQHFDDSEMF